MTDTPPSKPPLAVLDTHVLLDWLVFANPAVAPLVRAIEAGRLVWFASPALRHEHDLVVARAELARWRPDPGALGAAWARWARLAEDPAAAAPWRCTDPDDQKFLDLAWAARARWLITRDHALLKLKRRAAQAQLEIITPENWAKNQELALTLHA
jgi:predicted nucleic acid-binding protein